jgi:hypothetical protein
MLIFEIVLKRILICKSNDREAIISADCLMFRILGEAIGNKRARRFNAF